MDLGCGNGSSLFEMRLDGDYDGQMVGIDYSQQSVELARRLWKQHLAQQEAIEDPETAMTFEQIDFMKETASEKPWWPLGGFDLVLDKGTFDAVSLSAETVHIQGREARLAELYPATAAQMVKLNGFLLVTSVNWTEEELVRWFTQSAGLDASLKVYHKVKYPTYEFGGRKGQAIATVCFQKVV